jgi:Filamin/ABP280 repeat/Legume lectin domain
MNYSIALLILLFFVAVDNANVGQDERPSVRWMSLRQRALPADADDVGDDDDNAPQSFQYRDGFVDTSHLRLLGAATLLDRNVDAISLTGDANLVRRSALRNFEVGQMFHASRFYANKFKCWLRFGMSARSRDGLALVLVNFDSANYEQPIGCACGGMGYGRVANESEASVCCERAENVGIRRSLAVEFDSWRDASLGDDDANHVSVHHVGDALLGNSADERYSLGRARVDGVTLADGDVHTASIDYDQSAGAMIVAVDGVQVLRIGGGIDVPALLGVSASGLVSVGIVAASSSSAAAASHRIYGWGYAYSGHVDAAHCVVASSGDGAQLVGRAGVQRILVNASDQFGHAVPASGAGSVRFDVALAGYDGPLDERTSYVANSDDAGQFAVLFTVTRAGAYAISVTLGGEPIDGSPMPIEVRAAELSPVDATVVGPGAESASLGYANHLALSMRDRFGNAVRERADSVAVRLTALDGDTPAFNATAAYSGVGVYAVSYVPPADAFADVEALSLYASVDGEQLRGSPLRVPLVHSRLEATECLVSGAGSRQCTAGSPCSLQLETRDQYARPLDDPAAHVRISVSQMLCRPCTPVQIADVDVKLRRLGGGIYVALYTPRFAVTTDVLVQVNGRNVRGESLDDQYFRVDVNAGAVNASKTIAYGNGVGRAILHRKNRFTIQTRDALGNPLSRGGDLFRVLIYDRSQRNGTIEAAIDDRNDGTYDVVYKPPSSAKSSLSIDIALVCDRCYHEQGLHFYAIHGSPYHVHVVDVNGGMSSIGVASIGLAILVVVLFALLLAFFIDRYRAKSNPSLRQYHVL